MAHFQGVQLNERALICEGRRSREAFEDFGFYTNETNEMELVGAGWWLLLPLDQSAQLAPSTSPMLEKYRGDCLIYVIWPVHRKVNMLAVSPPQSQVTAALQLHIEHTDARAGSTM